MAASPSLHPRRRRRIFLPLVALLALAAGSISALAHFGAGAGAGGCPFSSAPHDHDHDHEDHPHHHHHRHRQSDATLRRRLPEELAEEEDLKMEAFLEHHRHHHHEHNVPSPLGLWMSAMGCSLLVSMASLICLVLLPVLFLKGKPSKTVVDSLAMFGAGAMLGDAFLHQLPHAFGGGHSHSHDHGMHDHHHHEDGHSHGHSFKDLSVGLSILAGIVLFLLVEKLVRYIEDLSGNGGHTGGHGHHHHGHGHKKLKVDDDTHETNLCSGSSDSERRNTSEVEYKTMSPDGTDGSLDVKKQPQSEASLRKRVQKSNVDGNAKVSDSENSSFLKQQSSSNGDSSSHSSLVFGYLNLFSDGVHNFTDGMALGSAFLLYGPVGGWSRTLFLLAHELPQEIGDFGILVRSGFTVSKALFFNFLSALVALLGTALALLLGKDPGHSSLIEGFTAGGFIYIAVAGVLPEMNNGSTTFRSSAVQLVSLTLGIGVALLISLAE